jgi:hypothetical protein
MVPTLRLVPVVEAGGFKSFKPFNRCAPFKPLKIAVGYGTVFKSCGDFIAWFRTF